MSIHTREELEYYLEADRIALGRKKNKIIHRIFNPDYIFLYQRLLRKAEYFYNNRTKFWFRIYSYLLLYKLKKMSLKLGFSLPLNRIGPGLAIPHVGPIIVNKGAHIGKNCTIHVGVNIGTKAGFANLAPKIGNNVYIGPGAKIFGDIVVADNIAIGANSVVNKSFLSENLAIGGIPAKVLKVIDIKTINIKATEILDLGVDYEDYLGLPALETYHALKGFGY